MPTFISYTICESLKHPQHLISITYLTELWCGLNKVIHMKLFMNVQ